MENKGDNKGQVLKYLFISVAIHGILLFLLSYFAVNIGTVFNNTQSSEYYTKTDLIYLEDRADEVTEDHDQIEVEEDKKEEQEEIIEEKVKEDSSEPDKSSEEKIIDQEAAPEETTEKEVVEEVNETEVVTEDKVLEEASDKQTGEDNLDTEDTVKNSKDTSQTEDAEPEEEILISKESDEEIKVAPETEDQEAQDNVTTEEETEEMAPPPPPPPPTAQEMIVKNGDPVYPKNAANTGIEGTVKLLLSVNPSGEIDSVEILESSQYEQLDLQAQRTIKYGWKLKADKSAYQIKLLVHFRDTQQDPVSVEYLDLSFDKK